jgi:hypothetical protein
MNKFLKKAEKEILQKKRFLVIKSLFSDLKNSLDKIKSAILDLPKPKDKITINKIEDFSNFPKFPKEISVNNLKEQKNFPDKIKVEKPDWFSLNSVITPLNNIYTVLKDLFKKETNLDRYKLKQNAISVRLVDREGQRFYTAIGGTSGGNYGTGEGGGAGGGYETVWIKDVLGGKINPATEEKQDTLIGKINGLNFDGTSLLVKDTAGGTATNDDVVEMLRLLIEKTQQLNIDGESRAKVFIDNTISAAITSGNVTATLSGNAGSYDPFIAMNEIIPNNPNLFIYS